MKRPREIVVVDVDQTKTEFDGAEVPSIAGIAPSKEQYQELSQRVETDHVVMDSTSWHSN